MSTCFNLDPRHLSPEPLVPPPPLPYVSRRALARVKNRLPPPTFCPHCWGDVELVSHTRIYNGREFGNWPYVYLCVDCGAYVGLHPDTDLPLGTLADQDLRERRKWAKGRFNVCLVRFFGKHKKEARNRAYAWLAERMRIPLAECHFAMFDIERCELAAEVCGDALMDGYAHGEPR